MGNKKKKRPFSAVWKDALSDIQLYYSSKSWGLLRNTYCTIALSLYGEKRYADAIPFLLLVKYLDFSGLSNNNCVDEYETLDIVSHTNITNYIRKAFNWMKQPPMLEKYYETALSMCPPLPFHYLPKDAVLEIIYKELDGYRFKPDDYAGIANKPSYNGPYFYNSLADFDGFVKSGKNITSL